MRHQILQVLSTDEEREIGAHILDIVDKVLERGTVHVSWFLNLSEQDLVSQIMRRFPDVSYAFEGGFPRAERKRLIVGPPNADLQDTADIVALRIKVKTGSQNEISQRDLQGAVLGLGLNRRFIGDIVLAEGGGELVASSNLGSEIIRALSSVNRYSAQAELISLDQLSIGVERKKMVKATVSALRIDAVAAAGFGKSRSLMAREIKSLRVRVNGSPAKSPSKLVKEGDIISLGGKGRIVLVGVGGKTKKERTVIEIERYY